ncbi:glycosyltransferase [Bacteroidota bacterium]
MTILQVTDSLANGGAEKFVVELSNELAKKRSCILCSVKSVENWMIPPKSISPEVELNILNITNKISIILFLKLFSLIRKHKPGVVHVHSSILVFYLYILSVLFRKIKFIQTVHNTLTPGYKKLFNYLHFLWFVNKRFINVCISEEIYKIFQNKYPRLQFDHIDNGIKAMSQTQDIWNVKNEIEKLKKNRDTLVFLAIGNYSDYKNFSMLAEVFNNLEDEQQDVILLIIGEGRSNYQANYEKITNLKSKNIYQLGLKHNVSDYMSCADALVMSSIKEGMPLVILEGLSLGLPVISTPAGGVVDVIKHYENGLLCSDFTANKYKQVVKEFMTMNDKQQKNIKLKNLQLFEERFSIRLCSERYLEIY